MSDFVPPSPPVLLVENLTIMFGSGPSATLAVDGATLTLYKGQTLGLVGESGSGKSSLSRAVLGLITPQSGRVLINAHNIHQARGSALLAIRRQVQMIFQDPAGSLDPRMTVGEAIAQPLIVHRLPWREEVPLLIEQCGLPREVLTRYPHQFSGGQRQRIAIARALALKPKLVICDEPTSALDVSMQAQILNLLRDLQAMHGLAYLLITHDMGVVAHMADTIAVMQRGRIVEKGDAVGVLTHPEHELTQRLAAAVRGRPQKVESVATQ